jgi:hypothetical protein
MPYYCIYYDYVTTPTQNTLFEKLRSTQNKLSILFEQYRELVMTMPRNRLLQYEFIRLTENLENLAENSG